MLHTNIELRIPKLDLFKFLFIWNGKITKNTAWELNGYRTGTLFGLTLDIDLDKDHRGMKSSITFLTIEIEFMIYDTRHKEEYA